MPPRPPTRRARTSAADGATAARDGRTSPRQTSSAAGSKKTRGARAIAGYPPIPKALADRLQKVRLLLCDVDGVLTNATVWMGDGREFKEFHIHDGLGLRLLQRHGVRVGWVSARPSTATNQRAEDLKIDFLHQDKGSKVDAISGILAEAGLTWPELCYVGDDVVDLGAIKRAGVGVAVANAIPEAKALARYVTRREGGRGAVREVVNLILQAQGHWPDLIAEFSR